MNVVPLVAGIDVGLYGALGLFSPSNPKAVACYDLPIVGKEIDPGALAAILKAHDPDLLVVERVHAMPRQGTVSMFSFGNSFGTIRGIIGALGIPVRYVTPREWKQHFRLVGKDKEQARKLATELWPTSDHFRRVKDHNRAEACLLAKFAADVILRGQP